MKKSIILSLFCLISPPVFAQSATVSWTTTYQTIDGFGAANLSSGASMSAADEAFWFGTGPNQIGISLLRVGVTDGHYDPGDCTSVSLSCAGAYVNDMKAVVANGGRIFATPSSPPAAYKTNDGTSCIANGGHGTLIASDYGVFATWLANYAKSVQTYVGVPLYAISVQGEPDICNTSSTVDAATYTAAQLDTFIKFNLGPTFASAGSSTLIVMPEVSLDRALGSSGGTCMGDSACANYVGVNAWHDYGISYNGTTGAVNSMPDPWASLGKKYWMTETSMMQGIEGISLCTEPCYDGSMADGLIYAAFIHDRIGVENANAWIWLDMDNYFSIVGNIALAEYNNTTVIAKRAYVLSQWAKFVRPGWIRIDSTLNPQAGVHVTAFKAPEGSAYAIVAVNHNSVAVSQTFSLSGFPTVTTVTPYLTDAANNGAAQATVDASSGTFSYSIPAQSVMTFYGTSSSTKKPAPPTNLASTIK